MGYALITGASGGIGRELAALFAADGHDLVITARSQERLDMVKTKLEQRFGVHVVTFAIDLSEANAPKKLHDFTTSQGIAVDHLVNNAGFADWTDFLDADWNRQNEMMQLNMHALAELTYRYGRDMRANGNTSSVTLSMPRSGPASSSPMIATIMPPIKAVTMDVCTALRTASRLPRPMALAMTTFAPSAMPMNRLRMSPVTGALEPTAATAAVPSDWEKLPTIMMPDALKSCSKIPVAATGSA